VFDDVNVDRTVQGALWGALTNGGQTCTSVERLYVHERIYPEFVEKLKKEFESIRSAAVTGVGANQGDLDVGGMTTPFQLDIVDDHIEDAVKNGAKVLVGGKRGATGQSYQPTLLVDVTPAMKIVTEETFGPVLPVMKFRDEAEVIALANHSPYGLNSSVWSGDVARAERVAGKLEAGNVCINNVMSTQANAGLPFGGVKSSGFGRYHGALGLHTFCNIKSIMTDAKQGKYEVNWYPYSVEKYRLFSKLMDALFGGGPFGLIKTALIGMKLDRICQKGRKGNG
ncbi:MAG: aldehyde dehydrogenase family protein, partial [Candidatus Hydrogenedentes bacterium]|nr:aldehyde dehydrogenase family protein [Candidatus Hydrogenedentota bacterium]